MTDHLKHLDMYQDEIKITLGSAIAKLMKEGSDENGFCPDCMTRVLLEMVAFMAALKGFSRDDIMETVTEGAEASEEAFENDGIYETPTIN